MERLGAPGAGLLIALENIFPPLPSEVILPLAGFTASRGDFQLWEALFWTTLGSVAGAPCCGSFCTNPVVGAAAAQASSITPSITIGSEVSVGVSSRAAV